VSAAGARSPRALVATGVLGGVLSGLVGGGGGAVMIPLLTGPLGLSQHRAHGTSLVIIVAAALAGTAVYGASGNVALDTVLLLVVAAMAGAYFGARGARRVPALRLRQALGAFLVAVALRLLVYPRIDPLFNASGLGADAIAAAIGMAGGLAAGALGVGGGAIFVPALVLLLGVDQHDAQGVSLAVIVFTAAAGALTHHRQGTVDLQAAAWIAPIAAPAGIAGSLAATALGGDSLRRIFSIVLLAIGIQMLATATARLRRGRRTSLRARRVAS